MRLCLTAVQWLVGSLQAIIGIGFVLLVIELVIKNTSNTSFWFRRRHFAQANVVLASKPSSFLLRLAERSVTVRPPFITPAPDQRFIHHAY